MKQRVLSGVAALAASVALTLGVASTASATNTTSTPTAQVGTVDDPQPRESTGCNRNICIKIYDPDSSSNVRIEGWARSTSFYGYIKFTGPKGLNRVAGPRSWAGGRVGGSFAFIGTPAVVGQYCVTGYFPDGSNNQGTACNRVG